MTAAGLPALALGLLRQAAASEFAPRPPSLDTARAFFPRHRGVIMFLRLGWVAGQAGLGMGTLIIVLANVVTTITALSLCAIATNGEVKGGGAYYLISRALGPQFGGALGVLFYVAQSVAVSLYVIGFAESVVGIYVSPDGSGSFTGDPINDLRIIGICTNVFLLIIALIGVGWYAKVQILLLVILIIAMLAVFIGAFLPTVPSEASNNAAGFYGVGTASVSDVLEPKYTLDLETGEMHTFFSVFAIFFPAVTGIMAGANMSGDLARPSVAIPKGTLWGIVVTFITYIALLWVVGSAAVRCEGDVCDGVSAVVNGVNVTYAYNTGDWVRAVNDEVGGVSAPSGGLVYNRLIMKDMAVWEPLLFAGVFAATLSSALASLVGAPRILQALAKDKLYNFWLLNWFAQLDDEEESKEEDSKSARPPAATPGGGAAGASEQGPGAHPLLVDTVAVAGTTGAAALAEDRDNVAAMEEESGESVEPKRGYFLTFVVACGCVLIGRLDAIAPLISNFFMISYALTNYAVFAASMSETPGWRPSFIYYNKYVSAIGAVLCVIVMFAFDWINALVSVVICIALYKYLEYTDPPKHWGPAGDAARYLNAVKALYKLRQVRTDVEGRGHVKTYRPSYLVLTDDPRSDQGKNLIMFIAKLYKGRGISVIGQVLLEAAVPVDEERFVAFANAQRRRNQKMLDRAIVLDKNVGVATDGTGPTGDEEAPLTRRASSGYYGVHGRQYVGSSGLAALALSDSQRQGLMAEVLVAPTLRRGSQLLLQLGGVGTLRANTLVHSYPEGWFLRPTSTQTDRTALNTSDLDGVLLSRITDFEQLLGDALNAGMGTVVLRDPACSMNDGIVPVQSVTGGQAAARVAPNGTVEIVSPPAGDTPPTVDVWWLADEGGLAVLLPHILTQHPQFSSHTLRVFTTGSPDEDDQDATLKAQSRTQRLAVLMNKLRLQGHSHSFKMDYAAVRQDTIDAFNALYPGLLPDDFQGVQVPGAAAGEALPPNIRPEALEALAREETASAPAAESAAPPPTPPSVESWARCPEDMDKDVRRSLVQEAKHILRCAELVRDTSASATVTFIVMPLPKSHYPPALLSTYMEVLSAKLGTVILVRGSGAPVITLSS